MQQRAAKKKQFLLTISITLSLSACASIQGRWYVSPDEDTKGNLGVRVAVMNQGRKPIAIRKISLCYTGTNTSQCKSIFDSADNGGKTRSLEAGQFAVWKGDDDSLEPLQGQCRLPSQAMIEYSSTENSPTRRKKLSFDTALPSAMPSAGDGTELCSARTSESPEKLKETLNSSEPPRERDDALADRSRK
jgi:hypothetical protein